MQKWEYLEVEIMSFPEGRVVTVINGERPGGQYVKLADFANAKGEEGWEWCSMASNDGLNTLLCVFKRERH